VGCGAPPSWLDGNHTIFRRKPWNSWGYAGMYNQQLGLPSGVMKHGMREMGVPNHIRFPQGKQQKVRVQSRKHVVFDQETKVRKMQKRRNYNTFPGTMEVEFLTRIRRIGRFKIRAY